MLRETEVRAKNNIIIFLVFAIDFQNEGLEHAREWHISASAVAPVSLGHICRVFSEFGIRWTTGGHLRPGKGVWISSLRGMFFVQLNIGSYMLHPT